jgi:multiple sugar transport system permease protein
MILGYVKGIPRDVEEAGMVDGLGRLAAFARLTLRMALPGVLAVGVFAFMTGWGEVLFASVLTTPHTETLPIALIGFQTGLSNVVNWNQLMAAALTVSIPIVGVFLSLQRYFVRGLGGAVVQ